MNIKIKHLELTNFKCFRHKEFQFNDDITTIRGRNGAGKTTIADAILWCLFGKNTQGQADFDLKTHDADGKPIPNLDHSVEMVLTTNAITGPNEITLKRTLKETWVKKRGSDEQVFKNNTTEYLVNGDAYTAADYKKYISELVNEDVFKAITSPTYFPSLKWQQQREFLTKMAGDITEDDFTKEGDDSEMYQFRQMLAQSNEDIIAYRKHLSYQIKQIKDKLDKIPVRLEEQNKALPEDLDFDALQMELEQAQGRLKEIDTQIVAIKSGNSGDVLRNQIRSDIKSVRTKLDLMMDMVRSKVRDLQDEHDAKVSQLTHQFNSLLNDQKGLELQIQSLSTLAKRCRETADVTFKEEQTYVREHWSETQIEFLGDRDGLCPYCHQSLPDDMLAEAKEKFNQSKAELKQRLTERANKAKQLLADAETEAKKYEEQLAEARKNLDSTKEQINLVFVDKQKAEKAPVKTIEECLFENPEYQELLKSKAELQAKLDSVGVSDDDTQALADLEEQKSSYAASMSQLQAQLATRDMRLKILALIEGINEEQKELVRQLSELERKEDVARRYQDRQNAILEERINEHFSLVKWKMFRTVNNGGDPFDEPFCECYVNGVAYHDGLNQAARLNAGLDILNSLCKHYGVSAPIIIDQSESTLSILQTVGQQVRLCVSDCDLQVL